MLQKRHVDRFRFHLQRLFSLKIGRTTFREMQNAILNTVEGNRDEAAKLFEALLRGELGDDLADSESKGPLKSLIDTYCVPARLSRDVYERGDFLQVITSDLIRQDKPMFVNRIRRIDGDEIQFITDVESTVHLLQHFVGRLVDMEGEEADSKVLEGSLKELEQVKQGLQKLLHKAGSPKK